MRNCFTFVLILFTTLTSFCQIRINLPVERSVFQRDNQNTSTIYVSGNYDGLLDKIEARLVPVKQGQGIETNWVLLNDKPEGGFFVGSVKGTGGWYQLQVRGWRNGIVINQPTVERVGIGEVFVIAGQSNAEGKRNSGEKTSTDDRVNCLDYEKIDYLDENPVFKSFSHLDINSSIAPRGQGAWCWGELGDLLVKRLNVPVMFFNTAYEGTTIENWYSSSLGIPTKHDFYKFTFPNNTPYSNLRIVVQYYISNLGVRGILWDQGEADFENTEDVYATSLKKVIDKLRSDCGKKVSWLISRTSLTNHTQIYPDIIKAQNKVINPSDYIFEGPYTDSIQVPRLEGVHFQNLSPTDAGISDLAKAWDKKLNSNFFNQSLPFLAAPIITLKANCAVSDRATLSLPSTYNYQKWSNNSTEPLLTAKIGTYSCIIRDNSGNYIFTNTIDVKGLYPTTAPKAYAKTNPDFCEGSSAELFTDTDYPSLRWNTGETKRQITTKTVGTYTVQGINSFSCLSPESNAVNTRILALPPKPNIFLSAPPMICEGISITLYASGFGKSLWSTNDSTGSITLNKVADYNISLKVKDDNGCISPVSDLVKIGIKPRPETPEISQVGAFTLQAKQKSGILTDVYEWKQDDRILSNRTALVKAIKPGFFTVAAIQNYSINSTQNLSCRSIISGAVSFIPDLTIKNVIIYPNPSSGYITLEAKEDLTELSLTVYSQTGQYIYSTPIPSLAERRLVDLTFLQDGKYILRLQNNTFVETKHIWIEKN